ncbi:MAG: hypothetical protein AAF152_04190 [Cyanobacteria bacterium P01_A01_bin.114]
MRSVVAVVVGYLTMSVAVVLLFSTWLSNPAHMVTTEFMVFAAIFGLFAALGGGYVTGLAAPAAPLGHAVGLAVLSAVMWGISVYRGQGQEPLWFQAANLASVLAGVLLGGYLRQRQVRGKATAE